jgi:hypothetical protein
VHQLHQSQRAFTLDALLICVPMVWRFLKLGGLNQQIQDETFMCAYGPFLAPIS